MPGRNLNPSVGKNFRYTGRTPSTGSGSSQPRNITGTGQVRYSQSYQDMMAAERIAAGNAGNQEPTAGQLIQEMRQTPQVDAYSYVMARSKQARDVEARLAKEKQVSIRPVNRASKFLEKYETALNDPQARRVEAALEKEQSVTLRSKGPPVQTYDDINLYRTSRINPSEYQQKDRAFVSRLKKLSEREQNLQNFKDKLYRSISLVKGVSLAEHPIDNVEANAILAKAKTAKGFEKFNLKAKGYAMKTSNAALEFTKAAARVPIELATMPMFIGGRTALAYDVYYRAIKDKVTRSDIKGAIKDLPKEIKSQFNPKTPDGQVNLVLAGLGVLQVAGAMRIKGKGASDIKVKAGKAEARLAEYKTEMPKVSETKLKQAMSKISTALKEGIRRTYKVTDKTLRESRGLTKKQWDVLGDKTQARIRADYEAKATLAAKRLNPKAAQKLIAKQKEAFIKAGLIDRPPTRIEKAKLQVRKFTRELARKAERASQRVKDRISPKAKVKTQPFEYMRKTVTEAERYKGMTGEQKLKQFRAEDKKFKREAARPYRRQGASADQLIENLKEYRRQDLVRKKAEALSDKYNLLKDASLAKVNPDVLTKYSKTYRESQRFVKEGQTIFDGKLIDIGRKGELSDLKRAQISKVIDNYIKKEVIYRDSSGKKVFDYAKLERLNQALKRRNRSYYSKMNKKGQIQILKQVEKQKLKVIDLDKLIKEAKQRMRARTKLAQPEAELKPVRLAVVAEAVSKAKAASIPYLKIDIKPKSTAVPATKSRVRAMQGSASKTLTKQKTLSRTLSRLKQYQDTDVITDTQTKTGQKISVGTATLTAIAASKIFSDYKSQQQPRPPKPKVFPLPPLSGRGGGGGEFGFSRQYFKFTHTIERPSRAIPKAMQLRRFTGAELR